MRTYGHLQLTATSPVQTFTEPITLAEAKTHLNLPERSPTDAAEDAMIEGFISGAREQAEWAQNRDLVPKQFDLYLDYFPYAIGQPWAPSVGMPEIQLRTPLVSVDLIRYKDSDGVTHDLVEGTDYIVDLARGLVMPPFGVPWPSFVAWPSSAVLVRHTAGFASTDAFWNDAGKRLKIGMLELISHWFSGRLPFELGPGVMAEYPFTVTALLGCGARERVA